MSTLLRRGGKDHARVSIAPIAAALRPTGRLLPVRCAAGVLATYGGSYLGFTQWALAMDPPPELMAAVVQVGPHDMSRAVYRDGVFDLYNYVQWAELIAFQERIGFPRGVYRSATADRRLVPVLNRMPFTASIRALLGTDAPWFEAWLDHPRLDDPFWEPLNTQKEKNTNRKMKYNLDPECLNYLIYIN